MDAELRDYLSERFDGAEKLNKAHHDGHATNLKRVEDRVDVLAKEVNITNQTIAGLPCDAHAVSIDANKTAVGQISRSGTGRLLSVASTSAAGGAGFIWAFVEFLKARIHSQ